MGKIEKRVERERIVQILYTLDLTKMDLADILADLEVTEESIAEMTKDASESLCMIDNIIERNLTNWKLNRLSFLDRAIIRFATYEMVNELNPFEIIINEAIELTKKFTDDGDGKSKSFNNKLLDNIKNDIYANE